MSTDRNLGLGAIASPFCNPADVAGLRPNTDEHIQSARARDGAEDVSAPRRRIQTAKPWPTSTCCGRELVEEKNGELVFVICRRCPYRSFWSSPTMFPHSRVAYPDEHLDWLESRSTLQSWHYPNDADESPEAESE